MYSENLSAIFILGVWDWIAREFVRMKLRNKTVGILVHFSEAVYYMEGILRSYATWDLKRISGHYLQLSGGKLLEMLE